MVRFFQSVQDPADYDRCVGGAEGCSHMLLRQSSVKEDSLLQGQRPSLEWDPTTADLRVHNGHSSPKMQETDKI